MSEEQQQDHRIDDVPTDERKAELEAAYEKQKDTDAPYKDVKIRTLGELLWVFKQRQWSVKFDFRRPDWILEGEQRPNLSGVFLQSADLSGADLTGADLSGVDLRYAILNGADLRYTSLSGAPLLQANLSGAFLQSAILNGADLTGADLSGASLQQANLSGADLTGAKFDGDTNLAEITLSSATVLRDICWNGADVTNVGWQQLPRLGDDVERDATTADKARANRQIATLLRSQGINAYGDRFAYRANAFERQANLSRNPLTWLPWLGSLLLDGVAGYGYKPGRILFWYLVTIAGFMFMYMKASEGWIPFGLPAPTSLPRLPWYEALILSVSSFHGRGFFQPVQSLGDPIAALASIEAVVGLFIEVSFIATFTQRFFGK